jgi:hypothetical protein
VRKAVIALLATLGVLALAAGSVATLKIDETRGFLPWDRHESWVSDAGVPPLYVDWLQTATGLSGTISGHGAKGTDTYPFTGSRNGNHVTLSVMGEQAIAGTTAGVIDGDTLTLTFPNGFPLKLRRAGAAPPPPPSNGPTLTLTGGLTGSTARGSLDAELEAKSSEAKLVAATVHVKGDWICQPG